MRRLLSAIAVTFSLGALTTSCGPDAGIPASPYASESAQALWQQAEYGMTVEQIMTAFPGSNRLAEEEQDSLASGAMELVRGARVEVAGHQFDPRFFFQDDKLVQVTLSLRDVNDGTESLLVFETLVTTLQDRYGQEVSMQHEGFLHRAEWHSGMTRIALFLSAFGRADHTLNIVYQVIAAADAG
jgi:hypothetical protein